MKYKVFLGVTASAGSVPNIDGAGVTAFYTKQTALICAIGWRDLSPSNIAYLWDGSNWTEYAQIP